MIQYLIHQKHKAIRNSPVGAFGLLSAMQPPPSDDIDFHYIRNLTYTISPDGLDDPGLEKVADLFIKRVSRYLRGRGHPETSKGKSVDNTEDSADADRRTFRAELLLRTATGSSSIPLTTWNISVGIFFSRPACGTDFPAVWFFTP